jgi:hypothetical protein
MTRIGDVLPNGEDNRQKGTGLHLYAGGLTKYGVPLSIELQRTTEDPGSPGDPLASGWATIRVFRTPGPLAYMDIYRLIQKDSGSSARKYFYRARHIATGLTDGAWHDVEWGIPTDFYDGYTLPVVPSYPKILISQIDAPDPNDVQVALRATPEHADVVIKYVVLDDTASIPARTDSTWTTYSGAFTTARSSDGTTPKKIVAYGHLNGIVGNNYSQEVWGDNIPAILNISLDVTAAGVLTATVSVDGDTGSVKLSASNSAFPNKTTTQGETPADVDSEGNYTSGTLITLAPGETGYVSALAYSQITGGGVESTLYNASILYAEQIADNKIVSARVSKKGETETLYVVGDTGVASFKWAIQAGSFPAAGTGTCVNLASDNVDISGSTAYGTLYYITVTPYSAASCGGTAGTALKILYESEWDVVIDDTTGDLGQDVVDTLQLAAGAVTEDEMTIVELSDITLDLGTISAGILQDDPTTPVVQIVLDGSPSVNTYIDMTATGAEKFMRIYNSGEGMETFSVTAEGLVQTRGTIYSQDLRIVAFDGAGNPTIGGTGRFLGEVLARDFEFANETLPNQTNDYIHIFKQNFTVYGDKDSWADLESSEPISLFYLGDYEIQTGGTPTARTSTAWVDNAGSDDGIHTITTTSNSSGTRSSSAGTRFTMDLATTNLPAYNDQYDITIRFHHDGTNYTAPEFPLPDGDSWVTTVVVEYSVDDASTWQDSDTSFSFAVVPDGTTAEYTWTKTATITGVPGTGFHLRLRLTDTWSLNGTVSGTIYSRIYMFASGGSWASNKLSVDWEEAGSATYLYRRGPIFFGYDEGTTSNLQPHFHMNSDGISGDPADGDGEDGDVMYYNGSLWVHNGTAWVDALASGSGIGGSGTTNTIPKFTAATTLGDSAITDDGSTVTITARDVVIPTAAKVLRIGTAAPTTITNQILAVKQASSTSGYGIILENAAGDVSLGLWCGTGGCVYEAIGSNDTLNFYQNGINRLQFDGTDWTFKYDAGMDNNDLWFDSSKTVGLKSYGTGIDVTGDLGLKGSDLWLDASHTLGISSTAAATINVSSAVGILKFESSTVDIKTGGGALKLHYASTEKLRLATYGPTLMDHLQLNSKAVNERSWVAGEALTAGQAVYLRYDGTSTRPEWWKADANLAAFTGMDVPLIGVVVNSPAANATAEVCMMGRMVGGTWTASDAGKPVYVTTTAGTMSRTAPSTAGDIVIIVGYIIDANEIYVNPQYLGEA